MKYSAALSESIHDQLREHLLANPHQEDLCFALYNTISGKTRFSGVIKKVVYPLDGERNLHGNVSFNSDYFDRVCTEALKEQCGICLMHSHPGYGWQDMSRDDVSAELMLAPRVKATTGLPFLGMTIGQDGLWSARFWLKTRPKTYKRTWCDTVRIAGKGLRVQYCDKQMLAPMLKEEFVRTLSAWGIAKQSIISRLRLGIVGLGSVGSIIAEGLLKTGVHNITLIDFDKVEIKNLDRLQGVGRQHIGKFKVDVIRQRLLKQKLLKKPRVAAIPYSIIEEEGLLHAIDCDILFCCVDRPWPRFVLNSIAYANLIPVVDGGIEASINKKKTNLDQARWKTHVVGPGRICLNCLGQYNSADVSLEKSGLLEDPTYISNLPQDHFINHGENVFAFSMGVASMEMQQFLSLILQPRGMYYGPKEFDFNTGNIDFKFKFDCKPNCQTPQLEAEGDKMNSLLTQQHSIAETARGNDILSSKQTF